MAQKLLTKAILKKLPALGANEEIGLDAPIIVKFFNPYGIGTWYATEFDGEDTFFGLVDLHEKELGYFSLSELAGLRVPPLRLPLERDKWWDDTKTLREMMD